MIARLLSKLWSWLFSPSLTVGDAVDRIERDLDLLRDEANGTVDRCREMTPSAFDDRRDRRAGDREGGAP